MSWPTALKIVNNSSPGTSDSVGGDDWDTLAAAVNAHSVFEPYTYYLFKNGSTYYAKTGTNGKIYTSNSSFKTVLQKLIDDASPDGTPTLIKIAEGDFTLNAQVTITSAQVGNIAIEGQGMGKTNILIGSGFNSLTNTPCILVGTSPTIAAGNTGTLTANKAIGSLGTTMSAPDVAKFAVGDYVLLRSTKLWCDPAESSSVSLRGEIHRVTASSGTSVTIDTPAFDTYNTADTAELINITAYITKNVTLKDLSIKKDSGFTGNTNSFFFAKLCDNLLLDGIEIVDDVTQYDSAINLYSCINSRIINCRLLQNPTNTFNDQYGITIRACCQNVIIDHCQSFGKYRHPFEYATGLLSAGFEGPPRYITVSNCTAWNSSVASFDSHGDGEHITIANCMAAGTEAGYGFTSRCKNVKFTSCVVNATKDHGMTLEENAHGCEIDNCTIANVTVAAKYGIWVDDDIQNVKINNNKFQGCRNQCIALDTGVDNVVINGNIFDSCGADNTSTEGLIEVTGASVTELTITNNDFGAGTAPANSRPFVSSNSIAGINFSGNNTLGLTNRDISLPAASTDVVRQNNLGALNLNTIATRPDLGKYGYMLCHTKTNGEGLLNGNLTAIEIGTGTSGATLDTTGMYRAYDTAATMNSLTGIRSTSTIMTRNNNAYFKTAVYLGHNTNVRVFAGLVNSSSNPASAADPLNALSGIGLWFDSDISADWKIMHNDSSGASVVDALSPTVSASTATLYPLEIYAVDDTKFRFVFNDVITDVSSNIPSTSNTLGFRVYMENTTGASRTFRMYYVAVRNDK